MKKILFLSFLFLGFYSASAQNYYMATPEGYGRNATGGGTPTASNTVTVTDWTAFKNAIKAAGSKVILVSGTITATYYSEKVVDKTIIGLPGAKLVNNIQTAADAGILKLKTGSNNVIIRNLIFEGPGAWDVGGEDSLGAENATNIWVDHCEFQDGMDGNFDIKGDSDNITVSWCKFIYNKPPKTTGYETDGTPDHRFSNLIGSGKADYPTTDNRFSITFKNCYWAEGCVERMPRARNAELHILNCYYNTGVGKLAIGVGGGTMGSTCYVENSDFAKVGVNPIPTANAIFQKYSDDGGTVALTFDGSVKGTNSTAIGTYSGVTVAAKPTYTYTVMPVSDVATYIPNATCGAGATLQVSATGVISTACPNLGVEDFALNGVKLYPTVVKDVLNVELSDAVSGDAVIDIYTIIGGKVLSVSKSNVSSSEKLAVNASSLSKGLYLCTVKIGEASTTLKFIKE